MILCIWSRPERKDGIEDSPAQHGLLTRDLSMAVGGWLVHRAASLLRCGGYDTLALHRHDVPA